MRMFHVYMIAIITPIMTMVPLLHAENGGVVKCVMWRGYIHAVHRKLDRVRNPDVEIDQFVSYQFSRTEIDESHRSDSTTVFYGLPVLGPPVWTMERNHLFLCVQANRNDTMSVQQFAVARGKPLPDSSSRSNAGRNSSNFPHVKDISVPSDTFPKVLTPANHVLRGSNHRFQQRFCILSHNGNIAVWTYYQEAEILAEWQYDKNKVARGIQTIRADKYGIPDDLAFWVKQRTEKIQLSERFVVIQGTPPLLLTQARNLYCLSSTGPELLSRISLFPDRESPRQTRSLSVPDKVCMLVLLDDQEHRKSLIFSWDGKTATPLDIRDKAKKNIEPFLPAKDVDKKITKAVTTMMLQRDKDEKEVAGFCKKQQEIERVKKLTEEIKKPKPMTLQERLQQNEKGK